MQLPLCIRNDCSLIWAQIGDVDPQNPHLNRKQEFIEYWLIEFKWYLICRFGLLCLSITLVP